MDLRFHPCSVAPAEGPEKSGPRRPTRNGYSCNNAHQRLHDGAIGRAALRQRRRAARPRAPGTGREHHRPQGDQATDPDLAARLSARLRTAALRAPGATRGGVGGFPGQVRGCGVGGGAARRGPTVGLAVCPAPSRPRARPTCAYAVVRRSLPRIPTLSHRRVERGSDCRPPS